MLVHDLYFPFFFRYTRYKRALAGHYLKGEHAPVWMIKGIPATEKGKTMGYELDN